ncbi:MAG: BMC domain-containing protein, partial [Geminicoccaceae bacterium]
NKWRSGSLVVPGQTLGVVECAPAAYIAIAANEAEKSAEIDIVEVRAVGSFGRLFISGTENSVEAAMEGAVRAIEALDGVAG